MSRKRQDLSICFIDKSDMALRMEQIMGIGIAMIFIGFAIVFFGTFFGAKESASKSKVAVGGFIGPIPFGFGNDKNLVWFVTILSLVVFILWIVFSFKFGR